MSENTKIQWATHTFNPIRGCTKVSEGCANCYAEKQSKRNPNVLGVWGDQGKRVVAADSYWRLPLKWNREAEAAGERKRVFCASLADVFEDRPEWEAPRRRLWELIVKTPQLDWLLLTKRPENVCRMLGPRGINFYAVEGLVPCPQPNVWIGVSVENQKAADERIPILNETPAAIRFLSCEPLLGPIEFDPNLHNLYGRIHWAIIGGESGSKARPCNLDWIRGIVRQCHDACVDVFVKQLGANAVSDNDRDANNSKTDGHKYALGAILLRDAKGGDIEEFPYDLRIREFPTP